MRIVPAALCRPAGAYRVKARELRSLLARSNSNPDPRTRGQRTTLRTPAAIQGRLSRARARALPHASADTIELAARARAWASSPVKAGPTRVCNRFDERERKERPAAAAATRMRVCLAIDIVAYSLACATCAMRQVFVFVFPGRQDASVQATEHADHHSDFNTYRLGIGGLLEIVTQICVQYQFRQTMPSTACVYRSIVYTICIVTFHF